MNLFIKGNYSDESEPMPVHQIAEPRESSRPLMLGRILIAVCVTLAVVIPLGVAVLILWLSGGL